MHAPEQGTGQAQTQALGLRSIVVSDIVTKIIEKKGLLYSRAPYEALQNTLSRLLN